MCLQSKHGQLVKLAITKHYPPLLLIDKMENRSDSCCNQSVRAHKAVCHIFQFGYIERHIVSTVFRFNFAHSAVNDAMVVNIGALLSQMTGHRYKVGTSTALVRSLLACLDKTKFSLHRRKVICCLILTKINLTLCSGPHVSSIIYVVLSNYLWGFTSFLKCIFHVRQKRK